ncbi:MAG: hypothetical protein ACHQX1_00015 [Candidatus Micrarchaeales archaeon]
MARATIAISDVSVKDGKLQMHPTDHLLLAIAKMAGTKSLIHMSFTAHDLLFQIGESSSETLYRNLQALVEAGFVSAQEITTRTESGTSKNRYNVTATGAPRAEDLKKIESDLVEVDKAVLPYVKSINEALRRLNEASSTERLARGLADSRTEVVYKDGKLVNYKWV